MKVQQLEVKIQADILRGVAEAFQHLEISLECAQRMAAAIEGFNLALISIHPRVQAINDALAEEQKNVVRQNAVETWVMSWDTQRMLREEFPPWRRAARRANAAEQSRRVRKIQARARRRGRL